MRVIIEIGLSEILVYMPLFDISGWEQVSVYSVYKIDLIAFLGSNNI